MSLTNSQYDEIMREYESVRSSGRAELARRREEVYKSIPGYEELEDQAGHTAAQAGIRLLSGDPEASLDLHDRLESLAGKRRTLLKEAGFPEDYLEPVYECPDCRDTGIIAGKKCHCFERKIIDRQYHDAGIDSLLENAGFDKLSYKYHEGEDLVHFQGAVREARKFIEDIMSDDETSPNLLLYGSVGTGKTFLSLCIAKELLDKGCSVIYYSSISLFSLLSDYTYDFSKTDELKDLRNKLQLSDLLIIDDLGTEKTNQFVSSQLFSCINERMNRGLSTIITTNLSFEQIRATYSDRNFSRLTSYYTMCRLTGPDIRIKRKLDMLANRKPDTV